MRSGRSALAGLVFAVASVGAWAQDDPHAACTAVGWVPREILERPVALRTGIGNSHDPVTTGSKEAQAFYDQGLAYLHSYVWVEAARSFHEALRRDPDTALAWVGLSRAYSGLEDPRAARDAMGKAQARAGKASEREQRRIGLRAKQLEAMEELDNASKHLAYKKALDEALAVDFSDAELWCLRGNAEEASAAGRGQRGGAASVAFYRQGWVGLLVASRRHEEALAAARELQQGKGTSTRAVGHALAGHALLAMGRLADAEAELRSAQGELDALGDDPAPARVRRSAVSPYVDGLRGECLL